LASRGLILYELLLELQLLIRTQHLFNLASLGLIPYELLCEICNLHEAQLLQRGRMTLSVVETFSKLLKIV